MNTGGKIRPHCMTADAVFLFSPEMTETLRRPAPAARPRNPLPPVDQSLRLAEVTSFTDFLALRDTWNELLAASDNNGIFLTWEWLTVWWEVFGRDKELCILLGYSREGELVGIAPLMRRNERLCGMPVRSIEFIGSGREVTPDQLGFITRPSHKNRFIRAVFEYFDGRRSWDLMKLRDMKEDRDLVRFARAFAKNGRRFSVAQNGICPYIELPKTWEGFLEKLSSQNRYNIGRKERGIAKKFRVEFSLLGDPGQLPQALGALEALHKKRMQEKGMDGSSLGESFWEFHRKVSEEFLEKGWLFLGTLSANGKITACQYTFCYNNRAVFYQSGIDPAFSRYSVGMLSTVYMIRESIRRGLAEYDFLRGAEEYKMHWTQTQRKNTEILVWNGAPRVLVPYLLFTARKFLGRVKRRLIRATIDGMHQFEKKLVPALRLALLPVCIAALGALLVAVEPAAPPKKAADVRGTWTWTAPAGGGAETYFLVIEQDSGTVRGVLKTGTASFPLTGARLEGNRLVFTAQRLVNGKRVETTFEGCVFGDSIEGNMLPGGETLSERSCWRAVRGANPPREPGRR